jgi:hypothetical protein
LDTHVHEQTLLLERLKYYEAAYTSSLKLLRSAEAGSEAQIHLFSAAKYYQGKISDIRKELVAK